MLPSLDWTHPVNGGLPEGKSEGLKQAIRIQKKYAPLPPMAEDALLVHPKPSAFTSVPFVAGINRTPNFFTLAQSNPSANQPSVTTHKRHQSPMFSSASGSGPYLDAAS
jgi:hypothetical protein